MILPEVRDPRPRGAVVAARAWADGSMPMMQARLSAAVRELVVEDQAGRDAICWSVSSL